MYSLTYCGDIEGLHEHETVQLAERDTHNAVRLFREYLVCKRPPFPPKISADRQKTITEGLIVGFAAMCDFFIGPRGGIGRYIMDKHIGVDFLKSYIVPLYKNNAAINSAAEKACADVTVVEAFIQTLKEFEKRALDDGIETAQTNNFENRMGHHQHIVNSWFPTGQNFYPELIEAVQAAYGSASPSGDQGIMP
jgi:hypothetical protein